MDKHETTSKFLRYICSKCHSKKDALYSECKSCGSLLGEPMPEKSFPDVRRPFIRDVRKVNPI